MLYKEYVDSFSWTNSKFVENAVKTERINGRLWAKLGKLQNVTFVGVLERFEESSGEPSSYVLNVGIAYQHPIDYKINQDLALETAANNARVAPVIRMSVRKNFNDIDFNKIIKEYYLANIHMYLKLIKTKEEIANNMLANPDFEF